MKSTLLYLFLAAKCYGQHEDAKLEDYLNSNKITKAYERLEALTLDSTHYWYTLGKIQRKRGDYLLAEESILKCLSFDSSFALAYDELGVLAIFGEDYEAAISLFQKAAELNKTSTTILGHLGATYYIIENFSLSLEYQEQVLSIEPKDLHALYNSGLCYLSMHQFEKAIEQFNQSLAIQGKDPKALFDRGRAFYFLHKYDLALKDFKRCLKYCKTENEYERIPESTIINFIDRCNYAMEAQRAN